MCRRRFKGKSPHEPNRSEAGCFPDSTRGQRNGKTAAARHRFIKRKRFRRGLELALACDIRIAAEHIELGLPETTLAIIPGAGGTQRLPRLIGRGKAKEMIFTGCRISAEEAQKISLVEHVVPLSKLKEASESIAANIAANGPVAVRQAKFAINQGLETAIETGLAIEQKAYELTIPTKDRTEGLKAFAEKRKPDYTGE